MPRRVSRHSLCARRPREHCSGRQMPTNLSSEEGSTGNVLEVKQGSPPETIRDWHMPHPETRNVCRGLEPPWRFEIRGKKDVKASILLLVLREEMRGCSDFWVLPQGQRANRSKEERTPGGRLQEHWPVKKTVRTELI